MKEMRIAAYMMSVSCSISFLPYALSNYLDFPISNPESLHDLSI